VLSAKIVAKSRTKQLRFGFITMATPKEAQRCIEELSGTELKGKKITVELVSGWGLIQL
jgi:RNA recognition motif-containing protein